MSQLASVSLEERRKDRQKPELDTFQDYRVHYMLSDDIVWPTMSRIVVHARTQDRAAIAVDEKINSAVPVYVEDYECGEFASSREVFEKLGIQVNY